jgi:signal transduction histidine kinase
LVLLAVAAVLVPAAAMAALQYRQAHELERKTEIAARETLRDRLTSVARHTEFEIVQLANDLFQPVNGTVSSQQVSAVKQHFSIVSGSHPELNELFVVSTCPICGHKNPSYVFSRDGTRVVEDVGSDSHLQKLLQIFSTEQPIAAPDRNSRGLAFWQMSCGCTKRPPIYVFRQIQGGFVGLSLDSDYIREHELAKLIAEGEKTGGNDADAVTISVLGEDNKELFSSANRPAHYDIVIPFAPVFPRWQLAAGYRGASIAGLAHRNFETDLLLDGLIVTLLLAGVLLTVRAAAREVRLAQAKSSFVSNVSHELKTPLALIRMFAETLELGRVKSKEKEHEYHRIIHSESRRLTQLINNILDFSRIEAGKKQYRFAACDLGIVVQQVLSVYEYQIASQGFELKTHFSPSLPPVRVDADALGQALLNLLDNAIKYSGESRWLEVAVQMRGSQVAIEVADGGIGIPEAEHGRIFEKFYRVSTGLVHSTKGTGLGLALVKHIVEAHGGSISVESAPARGSRFTILLPVIATSVPMPSTRYAADQIG